MAVKEYDVLIVGSGHSGGMAANILTGKGISCLMLNAGPAADYTKDRVAKPVYELPYHGFGEPGRHPHVYQANEFNANQWVDEREVPYTQPRTRPTTGCACAWWAAVPSSGRANPSASAIIEFNAAKSMAAATIGPSATPISTPTTRASKASSASWAARKAGRNFPMATSSRATTARTAPPSRR